MTQEHGQKTALRRLQTLMQSVVLGGGSRLLQVSVSTAMHNCAPLTCPTESTTRGSFLTSQAVGRAATAAGRPASIVLVASMSGCIVNYPQEQSCYNASEAGVVQLGRSLAAEWAKYNIKSSGKRQQQLKNSRASAMMSGLQGE